MSLFLQNKCRLSCCAGRAFLKYDRIVGVLLSGTISLVGPTMLWTPASFPSLSLLSGCQLRVDHLWDSNALVASRGSHAVSHPWKVEHCLG